MRNLLSFKKTLSFLLTGVLLCLGALPAQTAQAQTSPDRKAEIRRLLDRRDRQIKSILGASGDFTGAQRAELKTLINGLIDFRAMGREALGPHWNDLSYDQQQEFVSVFSQVVKEQSLADLKPYRAPVHYQTISVKGDSAYVKTTSVQQGERIPVAYDLVYRETDDGSDDEDSGAWRARDIVVDEVSTVDGYKRSFRSIIRRHGYDALMKSLHRRLERTRKSSDG